jgi:ABC-type Zn2+ transport system substrate-binding protein/surface adhesin
LSTAETVPDLAVAAWLDGSLVEIAPEEHNHGHDHNHDHDHEHEHEHGHGHGHTAATVTFVDLKHPS